MEQLTEQKPIAFVDRREVAPTNWGGGERRRFGNTSTPNGKNLMNWPRQSTSTNFAIAAVFVPSKSSST